MTKLGRRFFPKIFVLLFGRLFDIRCIPRANSGIRRISSRVCLPRRSILLEIIFVLLRVKGIFQLQKDCLTWFRIKLSQERFNSNAACLWCPTKTANTIIAINIFAVIVLDLLKSRMEYLTFQWGNSKSFAVIVTNEYNVVHLRFKWRILAQCTLHD